MNLEFSPEEIAFRDEVRTFIRENYPKELIGMGNREDLTREQFLAWHKILGKKGWSTVAWPKAGLAPRRWCWRDWCSPTAPVSPRPASPCPAM